MKRLISLLAATAAVVLLSTPGIAQTAGNDNPDQSNVNGSGGGANIENIYSFALDCRGAAANGSAGGTVWWAWLHNGVQISPTPDVVYDCAINPQGNGGGDIPTSINGIQVNGIVVTFSLIELPVGCEANASVTKSIDPSNPKFSIRESISAPNYGLGAPLGSSKAPVCPKASFQFSMKTQYSR
jgi:hypothetical protein